MLWLQDMRPVIKKKYPELSMTEISKKAGEMWKAVVDKSVSILRRCVFVIERETKGESE